MKKYLRYGWFLGFSFLSILVDGQQIQQTIRGRVIDKYTREPLIGATVQLVNSEQKIGVATDVEGNYEMKVPVDRLTISCQFVGYAIQQHEIIVNSARVAILNFELQESILTTDDVVISAYRRSSEPVNELAVVSARSFSPEETERYAASVNDPGRMALSFPGVSQGGDEAENDIIIRGNSSRGMLWRLEGIDIANPNHFARPGTSGGGVTVFSAQLLSKSDFYSGGMPADYGNALSGAFDINFRAGNMTDREYRTKIGLLGLDFMTEGPIKNGQSSYLVNYRYSTLGILTNMGVYLVGERVTNEFQDLSFNNSFILKNGKDVVTVFGIGGLSQEHYQPVENPADRTPGVANEWEDRLRNHNMGALGMTYNKSIDETSFLKWVVAVMGNYQRFDSDTLDRANLRYQYGKEQYEEYRISTSLAFNKQFNPALRMKAGLQFSQIFFDYYRLEQPRSSSSTIDPNIVFGISLDGEDQTQTIQTYAQFTYQLIDKLTVHGGFHQLALMLNQSIGVDPRASLVYELNPQNSLRFSAGRFSQIVPLGTYFFRDDVGEFTNMDLGLMKAYHYIFGYRTYIAGDWMLNLEAYLQYLQDIPTRADGDQEFWLLNTQSGFPTYALNDAGTGQNKGLDLTVEKRFSKGIYLLLTGSVFESTYTANDGPVFDSNFNTRFSSSHTLAKEWKFGNSNVLQIGGRILYNGGYRFTPLDELASLDAGRYVPLENSMNSGQVNPYFRIDSRMQYRINRNKRASVISLDVQNTTNRFNPRGMTYNAVTNSLEYLNYVSGLVPVLSYQIDF